MRSRLLLTVALPLALAASDAAAQSVTAAGGQTIVPGTRVRVQYVPLGPDGRPHVVPLEVTGELERLDADSVVVRRDGSRRAIARGTVRQLDVSGGGTPRGRSAGRGALIGGAIGVGAGALLGLSAGEDPGSGCTMFCFTRGEAAVALGTLFGLTGVTVGALVGAATGGERWQRVPLAANGAMGLTVTPDRVAVTLRF